VSGAWPNSPQDARYSNNQNSLGCRTVHAQAAALAPGTHCPHAGPSGGGTGGNGVCGSFTDAWASLSSGLCQDTNVGTAVASIGAANMALAVPIGDTSAWSYPGVTKTANTQACRIYHLVVASQQPALHCVHGTISGGYFCGADLVQNLCAYIQGICGFGSATWQFMDSTTCYNALNTTVNVGGTAGYQGAASVATMTLGCRFYHATVAGSYKAGGSLGNGTTATQNFQDHCSHTLGKTPQAGCNYVAPSSAPTVPFLAAAAVATATILVL